MKKYLKIYALLLKLNFSALLAYRANFINNLISTLGWSIVSITSMSLLTLRTNTVFGWSRNELLAATGLYSVIIGVFGTLFSKNFRRFSRIVHLGQLDSFLTKPADSQFLLTCWLFNYAGLARAAFGISYTIYIIHTLHVNITPLNLLLFVFFTFSGILLLYSLWFFTITFTIWFTTLSNLIDFLFNFNNLARYPSGIIRQTQNAFIMVLLPLTLVATLPIQTLTQKAQPSDQLLLLVTALTLFILSRKFWKFALRHYTSASG